MQKVLMMVGAIFTSLSFGLVAVAQAPNAEVFLLDIKTTAGKISVSNPRNISNSKGYDNQPSFGFENKSILFTSVRGENATDIYEYFVDTGKTVRITETRESEYTARERTKGTITFVREGFDQTMTVFSMNRKTGKESPALKNKEPVAYYDWNSKGGALVWVRYAWQGRYVEPSNNINNFVTDSMQASAPQVIPGTDKFSFVYRRPDGSQWIKEFDPATKGVRPMTPIKEGSIDYCWTPDQQIITGVDTRLYSYKEGGKWELITELKESGITGITRMAVSGNGKYLVLVGVLK